MMNNYWAWDFWFVLILCLSVPVSITGVNYVAGGAWYVPALVAALLGLAILTLSEIDFRKGQNQ